MTTMRVCTFTLGELWLGVEVESVQEVLRFQQFTPVPLSAPSVRGLINLRGNIVTAIDLRVRLQLDEPRGEEPMNVVLRVEGGVVSLLVDGVGEVVDVKPEALGPPPRTLVGPLATLVRGVHSNEGKLLLVLDADDVVALEADSGAHGARSDLT